MADNLLASVVASDEVTYSGDAGKHVQLIRPVKVTGAEGSKTIAEPRILLSAVPTISTTPAYASGDQFGTVMTFAAAALNNGGGGEVVGATITNRAAGIYPLLELWLCQVSPTMVNADNGVFDLTDANLEAANVLGVIDFAQWTNTSSGQLSIGTNKGQALRGAPLAFACGASDAAIYGIMKIGGAFTMVSTTDIRVQLIVDRL